MKILNLREHPEWAQEAADYYSETWGAPQIIYSYSINASQTTPYPVPRWYIMIENDEIIGGYGLIDNDFVAKTDLYPWLCALHIDESQRGKSLGAKLLEHCRIEAGKLGFEKVYLNTDHVGYYEKYGWNYIGEATHTSGDMVRVYEAEALSQGG